MNNKRIIDANEFVKAVLEHPIDGEAVLNDPTAYHLITWLLDFHTVDAVEVVRCKDCKHCERDHTLDAGGDEYYYCSHDVMEHGQARANEFCCYGERRATR